MSLFALLYQFTLACQETEIEPSQFNAPDESLSISVGVSDILPAQERTLYSSTGLVEIGKAVVDPGGGPSGTVHQILVEVHDEYAQQVQLVDLKIDSGTRGILEYTLIPDSAETRIHVIEIQSVAEESEIRDDIFTFSLWNQETLLEEEPSE